MKRMRSLAAVDSTEISVVIQGPLNRDLSPERNIFACIASIRAHLPHAEIVVSTWQHEDASAIDADRIIVIDDPGFFVDESGNQININRMLSSTSAGIQAATRPYIMKLRSDHNLTSAALAVVGKLEHSAAGEPKLFDTPITLTTLYIRDPQQVPMLFHISDLVQFGTREAMLALWDQPLLKEEDVFSSRPSRNPFGNFQGYSSAYRVPEQSLMLGAMRMQGIDVALTGPCQVGKANLKLWDSILTLNFRVLDYRNAGVDFPERFLNNVFSLKTIYSASDIEHLNRLGPMGYQLRMARIWINQYPLSCIRPAWWISLASIILFSVSPALAKIVRSHWRKIRKLTHAGSDRV
jgi:hypothetical protein